MNRINIKNSFWSAGIVAVSYGFFVPFSLIISNNDDFLVDFKTVFPYITMPALALMIVIFGVGIIFGTFSFSNVYYAMIYALGMCLYLQANWINPKLPELDGRMVAWDKYTVNSIINCVIWVSIITIFIYFAIRMADKALKIYGIIAVIVILIQASTIAIMCINKQETKTPNIELAKDGEFELGSEKNVIIFALDSFGPAEYEKLVEIYPDLKEKYKDFTFYNNEVAGGSYTNLGIPVLLTGAEYDVGYQGYETYMDDAWKSVDLYNDLHEEGYDIRLYTDNRYIRNVSSEVINNSVSIGGTYVIKSRYGFTKQLYKLVSYCTAPTVLKKYFWMNTDDVVSFVGRPEDGEADNTEDKEATDNYYSFDDAVFADEMRQNLSVSSDYDKAYRFYHLWGQHAPFTLNADGERVDELDTNEDEQTYGCLNIINSYMEYLKEQGLYDSSTIIVTADHGTSLVENGIQHLSCLMVKMYGQVNSDGVNSSPVHARNLISTIANEALEDAVGYGPSLEDIKENSDVERLHTAMRASAGEMFPELSEDISAVRCSIGADGRDFGNIKIYDSSKVNRISYSMGDVIDFTTDNQYTKSITDRIYYDDVCGMASNELHLFFTDVNCNDGDVILNFTIGRIMGESQKIRVYAEGERIATLNCNGDKGEAYSVVIPRDYIHEGIIPIRMVFPGALTPNMLDRSSEDYRVMSVGFATMWLSQ